MSLRGQSAASTGAALANGASTPHELFVLTDEQILEIEPEGEVHVEPGFSPASSLTQPHGAPPSADAAHSPSVILSEPQASEGSQLNSNRGSSDPEVPRDAMAQAGVAVPLDPPAWLAAHMNDPWTGAEAKEFWNGVQQSKQEAAAYRAAFATPEEARALKELYPGGVTEARASVNRARLLEQIDQAYFGAAGGTPEQASAARSELAAMMLREDPAAFREMVFAGLRALEEAEKGSTASANASNLPRLAQVFAASRPNTPSAVGATLASPAADGGAASAGGASPAPTVIPGPPGASPAGNAAPFVGARHAVPAPGSAATNDAHVAAYAAFEKAANEDLERSVGAAITRTIEQALPNIGRLSAHTSGRAGQAPPLQDRLSVAVRQDVEAALKGDRQLGEQIAQILAARRFDNETRAQVVRLIDDRARQLVPSAAKRVLNDWTQATLAAHRGNASRTDAANARREVEPASAQSPPQRGLPASQAGVGTTAFPSQAAQTRPGTDPRRNASRSDARRVDYRKLSDEQILEM